MSDPYASNGGGVWLFGGVRSVGQSRMGGEVLLVGGCAAQLALPFWGQLAE